MVSAAFKYVYVLQNKRKYFPSLLSFSFFHAEIVEYYLNGWNVRLNYNRDIVFIQVFSTKVPKFGCTAFFLGGGGGASVSQRAISHCSKLDRVNFIFYRRW